MKYDKLSALLKSMTHSRIGNYVLPGLTSSLIGDMPSKIHGCVRLFEASREQHLEVTPHSHRFDFHALVLQGHIVNRLWEQDFNDDGDFYQSSLLTYKGACGQYEKTDHGRGFFQYQDTIYEEGQWYDMLADQIHSINFSRDAVVLFIEGPTTTDTSLVLEPCVDGVTVETLKTEPWMFLKGSDHGRR